MTNLNVTRAPAACLDREQRRLDLLAQLEAEQGYDYTMHAEGPRPRNVLRPLLAAAPAKTVER